MIFFRRWVALMLALMILFSGCDTAGNPSNEVSGGTSLPTEDLASEEETAGSDLLGEMDAIYARLDTYELPRGSSIWQEATLEEVPPQLVLDDPLATELALHIRKGYLYAYGNILEPFDGPDNAFRPAILQTALYHAEPVLLGWQIENGIYSSEENPNHILSWLVKNENEEGRSPSSLFYASDVEEFIRTYYGKLDFFHMSPNTNYIYHEREAAYTRIGDYGGPWWRYPQITALEELEDGLVCEAVLVWALDPGEPMHSDNQIDLTPENILTATVDSPLYRYTFRREADDRLVLQAFEILRPAQYEQ